MRLSAGRGDCSKARTRKEIFTAGAPAGEADQYFRTGPTGGPHGRAARSLPLSPRLRLTLRRVVSEASALPRTTSELAERRRTRAVPGGILAGRREFRGCTAAHGIADPRGDIAGDPAAGYGRFRFRPNIIRLTIISVSANSMRTAPKRGAKNKRPGWF